MQVVYEKSITDKVLDAQREARESGKKIAHIFIDEHEWLEIHEATRSIFGQQGLWYITKWKNTRPGDGLGVFCGIRIRKGEG